MSPKKRVFRWFSFVLAGLCVLYSGYVMVMPLPSIAATAASSLDQPGVELDLPWPNQGQAAVGLNQDGALATYGAQKKQPIASIAKVMTALAILDKQPLKLDQTGPKINLTDDDVALYNNYVAKEGSVIPVVAGEQLSEYQILVALMLPSANNVADSATNHLFGSQDKYVQFANQKARDLGMKNSYFADASGFSPATVSTAQDLVLLGQAAIKQPVLLSIVGQKTATLPIVGQVSNVDWLLGTHGIDGIKTGNTDEAGGCFLFTSLTDPDKNDSPRVVGAVLGEADLSAALNASAPLAEAAVASVEPVTVVKAGDIISVYKTPWGETAGVTATHDVTVARWKGTTLHTSATITPLAHGQLDKGANVGHVSAKGVAGDTPSTDLASNQAISGPSFWWRLLHPQFHS